MGHKNNNYPSIESQQYAGSESSMEDNGEQEWVRNEQVSVVTFEWNALLNLS